jgi:MFS family permease
VTSLQRPCEASASEEHSERARTRPPAPSAKLAPQTVEGSRRERRRVRLAPPSHALVPGGASGTRATVVVALGFVAMLASSPGQSYWLSLFVDDMIAGTGLGRTAFSAVYAGATVFSAAMVLVVGGLVDRRGPALTWALVAVALAAGSLLMSVAAGALVALVALGMLRAFGQGSFPLLSTLLVARSFGSWRGRALAVSHLGSTLAAAALPPVAAGLLAVFGWRASLQITALVILVAILPVALAVRWAVSGSVPPRPIPKPPSGAPVAARVAARARRFPWRDGGATLLLVLSASPLISTAVVFHATSILADSGVSRAGAAGALSLLAVSAAVGAVLGGTLVDRVGVRPSLIAMSVLLALAMALLLVPSAVAALAAFAVLGLASGVNSTGSGAAWARTFGVERLGELQGVGEAARISAAALGPLPLAVALLATGAYAVGLTALGAFAMGCALLSVRWHPAAAARQPAA